MDIRGQAEWRMNLPPEGIKRLYSLGKKYVRHEEGVTVRLEKWAPDSDISEVNSTKYVCMGRFVIHGFPIVVAINKKRGHHKHTAVGMVSESVNTVNPEGDHVDSHIRLRWRFAPLARPEASSLADSTKVRQS
jgi:hypothetical protein